MAAKKRSSKRALNAESLTTLGASRLAELLLDLTADDPTAKRRLRLELAVRTSAEAAARLARTRLAALQKAQSDIAAKRMPAIYEDLKAHQRAIHEVAAQNPRLGLELLWLFVGAAGSVRDRCSVDPGVWLLHREAVDRLGEVAKSAKADPDALAEDAFRTIARGNYGAEAVIPVLSPSLGDQGIAYLKRRLQESEGHLRWRHRALLQIADAEGDVDGFIALHTPKERKQPRTAAEIAHRLLRSQRAEEALEALDAAEVPPTPPGFIPLPDHEWTDARIATLDALGRQEEAQRERWSCFGRSLSAPHLRAWLRQFPDFDSIEAEERAFDHAERFRDATEALAFFLDWPDLARASALVLGRARELDGERHELLIEAAEALAARYPLAATLVLRSLIESILADPRSRSDKPAARHLAECANLAASIREFGSYPNHHGYLKRLRERHPYSFALWSEIK